MGTETTGVLIDPDETFAREIQGRPQEEKSAGFEAPSEIRRQSGRVDVQDAVEKPAKGKQELLYAVELLQASDGGQPKSALVEVSCSLKGSFVCSRLLFGVVRSKRDRLLRL